MASDIEAQIKQAGAKNAELQLTLAQTDYAAPALAQQSRMIQELDNEIARSNAHLEQLDRVRQDELHDHEKYRDSNVRRFLHNVAGRRDKFDAKAAKEEKEYFEALQAQHEAHELNNSLRHQREEAVRVRESLRDAQAVHESTQRELDGLYHSIFAGENPSFPNEDQLERASNQALQTYHNAREDKEKQDGNAQLLRQAEAKAREAASHMSTAHYMSQADIMGRGMMADLREHDALNKAAVAMQVAKTLAARAGVRSLPQVNIQTGGMMADIMFDNIWSDLQRNQNNSRSEMQVRYFREAIAAEQARAMDKQSAAARRVDDAARALENARRALQVERQNVFESVMRQ